MSRGGLTRVVAVLVGVAAVIVPAHSAGAGDRQLTHAERCEKLIALGQAGQAAYDTRQRAQGQRAKARVLTDFYKANLATVRALAASPPRSIAKDLAVLERVYEKRAMSKRVPGAEQAGRRITRYVERSCTPSSVTTPS
jgi:hypothetical protein